MRTTKTIMPLALITGPVSAWVELPVVAKSALRQCELSMLPAAGNAIVAASHGRRNISDFNNQKPEPNGNPFVCSSLSTTEC